ncbi:MAG TPA: DapH/DapD/GlmU-related protein [Thermoanaerobaculia bacterium]|nr:DapH/DapD/GlmU-related protein [Thermoanaerobaculia bacterium]
MTLIVSPTATISPLADIEDSVRGSRIVIGDGVRIDSFVKIKPAGGSGDVVIGANSYVNSGTVIYSGNGVTIGEDVLIAANCTFASANHAYGRRDLKIVEQRFAPSKGGIVVGDDCWIGANAVLVDGAILGRGCVVGACALVRGEFPPYAVLAGVPARIVAYRE